ncbi:MAG: hypothetical protein QGI86_27045 [Candidatus Poribacteria bacterium]|nr:hypothetical protein [Candidatus Poribacteria bacterium]MDP6999870.1 hypothetical protein [Candidatus Poribacteria bacterium]
MASPAVYQRTYPHIAAKVPAGAWARSQVKRFSCWLNNKRIDLETYFLPSATCLLESLAYRPFLLLIDGSAIGQSCST